jgi:hypothetical protein
MMFFLIDRVIQKVYAMQNIIEKHFSLSIAPMQSRGESLVITYSS